MAVVDLNAHFDKISRLNMTYRVLIFAGTLVLLIGLYVWLIQIPKTGEIAALKTEINRLDRQIGLAKVRAKNLARLEKELAQSQADLRFSLKLLPTSSEIPGLLKNITKLGNDSNLEFLLFSPQKELSKEFYVEIPVSMGVRGGYHDVAAFFDKVGKLDRIVNVVDVSMLPAKQQSTTLNTTFKAVTYRFDVETEVKDAPRLKK